MNVTLNGKDYPLRFSVNALCCLEEKTGKGLSDMQSGQLSCLRGLLWCGLREHFPEETEKAYAKVGGTPHLDYRHTVFGQVYLGMDVVDAIAAVKTDGRDKPLEPVVMEGIAVSTYEEDGAGYDGEDIAAEDEN